MSKKSLWVIGATLVFLVFIAQVSYSQESQAQIWQGYSDNGSFYACKDGDGWLITLYDGSVQSWGTGYDKSDIEDAYDATLEYLGPYYDSHC